MVVEYSLTFGQLPAADSLFSSLSDAIKATNGTVQMAGQMVPVLGLSVQDPAAGREGAAEANNSGSSRTEYSQQTPCTGRA